jgi:2-polyprenyl-3-methyl-5-hydroxy-6-metoxy-1,4-benzoquinol methylase
MTGFDPLTQSLELAKALCRLGRRKDIKPACAARMAWQLWLIREQPGTEVADVGCNTGVLSLYLAQLGYRVTGFDLEDKHLEVARRGLVDCRPAWDNLNYKLGDAKALPVLANTFDWAICTEVIEHIPHPVTVFHELVRVVKPGGRVYMSTPYEDLASDPSHVNKFAHGNIVKLAESAGQQVEFCCSADLYKYLHWTMTIRK